MTNIQENAKHPAGHEPETARLTLSYILWATFWLLVGTAYGLLAAIKLFWPEFAEHSYLSFGRIRPIHTNLVLFGWSSIALIGIVFYIVSRTSKIRLYSTRLSKMALWCWNIAMFAAVVSLSIGVTQGPQEYRELVWPIAVLYALGLILNGYNCYKTVSNRSVKEVYVSNWYILGAFCWMTTLYIIAYVPFYQNGMGNIVTQGYYMHNAVGMWFTPLVLGITYYVLPRLLSKPIYSYSLGVLGFWTNMLFYTLIGAHHFIFSPISWWLQSTAILFSVGMMVPVWAGAGNFFMTAKDSWRRIKRDYALIFLLVGVWGYALASTQGTIEAFRTANIYWHFTNFTVGHSHLSMYGFIAFMIWGSIYGIVPRITGNGPSQNAIALHFWLSFVGGSIYVISISIAGILQGISWVEGESFIASVHAAAPMWLWRTIGGAMMVASHLVFARNVWTMRPSAKIKATTTSEALA